MSFFLIKFSNSRHPIKKRKPVPPEPNYPKCICLYAYVASDSDELSFEEGDIIYIVKEGKTNVYL